MVHREVEVFSCVKEQVCTSQSCPDSIGFHFQDGPAKLCRIKATRQKRELCMTLVHVELAHVSMRDLCEDPRPGRIQRVGVNTQVLFFFAVSDRHPMGESVLTGFISVQFSLPPAKAGKAERVMAPLEHLST